jgi:hypothetical protein
MTMANIQKSKSESDNNILSKKLKKRTWESRGNETLLKIRRQSQDSTNRLHLPQSVQSKAPGSFPYKTLVQLIVDS